MSTTVILTSTNYSGQTANITYFPDTGGTVSLGSHVIPYTFNSNYYYGNYQLYFDSYGQTCYVTLSDLENTITIIGNYFNGSIGAGYNITSKFIPDTDLQISFKNILNTISGPPIVIDVSTILYSGQDDGYGKTVPAYPVVPRLYWNKKVYPEPSMQAYTGSRQNKWIDHILIRYADVLLIAAEAANELGGTANITNADINNLVAVTGSITNISSSSGRINTLRSTTSNISTINNTVANISTANISFNFSGSEIT